MYMQKLVPAVCDAHLTHNTVSHPAHTLHTHRVTPHRWEVRAVTGVTSTLKRLGARWGKPVVVAEIGWPSASGGADTNVGSTATARAFAAAWTQVRCRAGKEGGRGRTA
jgi:hypothetical protein